MQHQYPQYGYTPQESPFAFPSHPTTYRTHHPPLKVPDYVQPGAPQQLQHGQSSPINPRKRGASELGDLSLPGSSNSNANAFQGLMAAPGPDLDVGVGASQHTMPSPIIKKGRTNTPWTPAEEQRLKTLREAGRSWSEIAKTFPARTEGSVKKHWYKVSCVCDRARDCADAEITSRICTMLSLRKMRSAPSFASPRHENVLYGLTFSRNLHYCKQSKTTKTINGSLSDRK